MPQVCNFLNAPIPKNTGFCDASLYGTMRKIFEKFFQILPGAGPNTAYTPPLA
jgi:hypothetical protein